MRLRLLIFALAALAAACHSAHRQGPRFVTTINPLRAILAEVVGKRGEVIALVSPGVSPHTYEPRPADAASSESALALLYAASDVDGWAAKLPSPVHIEMKSFVPPSLQLPWMEALESGHPHAGEEHTGIDGHFWSDPTVVEAMLPELVARLSSLDPEGTATYRDNAARFSRELKDLHAELTRLFDGVDKKPIFLFHPSWNYFMNRYGLPVAGMVEPDPGKESTAQYLKSLVDTAKSKNVAAVFTEPQLPRRPAEVIAEACGVPLRELDPNGGVPGRMTYKELLLFNATALREALK